MPRIQAPTVAEHRARQRRAILDAARAHLAEEGRAPSLAQVVASVQAADTPGEQVWAYVAANLRLFASSEQAVARALTSVVDPTLLAEPVSRFHQSLQEPLVAALEAHGEAQPQLVADIIDSMVVRASRDLWEPVPGTTPLTPAAALDLLRRLLGPYLAPVGSGTGGRRSS